MVERPVEDDMRTGKTGSFLDHIGDTDMWSTVLEFILLFAVLLIIVGIVEARNRKIERKEHFEYYR